jgi:hypothetical protein
MLFFVGVSVHTENGLMYWRVPNKTESAEASVQKVTTKNSELNVSAIRLLFVCRTSLATIVCFERNNLLKSIQ